MLESVLSTGHTDMGKTRKEKDTITQETSSSSLASRSSRSAGHWAALSAVSLGSSSGCWPNSHRTKTTRKALLAMPGIPFPSLHLCSQDPADYTCHLASTISSILRAEPRAGAGKRRKGRHGPQWVGSVVPRSSWRTRLSRGSGQHRPFQPPPIGAPCPLQLDQAPIP